MENVGLLNIKVSTFKPLLDNIVFIDMLFREIIKIIHNTLVLLASMLRQQSVSLNPFPTSTPPPHSRLKYQSLAAYSNVCGKTIPKTISSSQQPLTSHDNSKQLRHWES